MAGDWIKMRTNLDNDPRVIEIASQLGIPELQVVGCLWKIWAWADSHSLDGNAIRVTIVTLDRFTCVSGFAEMLRKVGWLEGRDGALTFPRFSEHNGQTAKKRAETKDRVAKHRKKEPAKGNKNSVTNVTQDALPEKRREEDMYKSSSGAEDSDPVGEEVPDPLAPVDIDVAPFGLTLTAAIDAGNLLSIPEEVVRLWWDARAQEGWQSAKGHQALNDSTWRPSLRGYAANLNYNESRSAKGSPAGGIAGKGRNYDPGALDGDWSEADNELEPVSTVE